MGSLEEENLFEMVYDYIEPESASSVSFTASQSLLIADHHTEYYILQELLENGMVAEIFDVQRRVLKHMRKKMDSGKNSTLRKWLVMRLRRDGFTASLCKTSWPNSFSCPGGEYEYIEVIIQEQNQYRCSSATTGKNSWIIIIDIDFKSQFEVARPTSSYKELTETLPEIFVGDCKKLSKIISLMCSEGKHSLRERGLHVPPWRTDIYMQSKWFAKKTTFKN